MKKSNILISKKGYYIILLLLVILRQLCTIGMPIYARDASGADEYLMLVQAESLLQGKYLGDYNFLTLVHGSFFPFFLAVINKLGIPYLTACTILYTIASLLLLYVFHKLIDNCYLELIFFVMVLFCPSGFELQLVYRNVLNPPQVMILIACLMMIYYVSTESISKMALWGIGAGMVWATLWFTREDAIWSIPLVIVSMAAIIIKCIKSKTVKITKRVLVLFVPISILILSIQLVSALNYKYYGVYLVNELNDSNYNKAYKEMMRIKPDVEVPYVEVTHDTLKKIYKVSPSMQTLEDSFENYYEETTGAIAAGYNPDNGEFNEDLFSWMLRGVAATKGYYKDAKTANEYWGNVYNEIRSAIDSGQLETRNIMPSRSMIPWPQRKDSLISYLNSFVSLYKRCLIHNIFVLDLRESIIDEEVIRRYEAITGNCAVYGGNYKASMSGWFFSTTINEICYARIVDSNGQLIYDIPMKNSEDIYNNVGEQYENTQNCRFDFEIEVENIDDLFLNVFNQKGETLALVCLKDYQNAQWRPGIFYAIEKCELLSGDDAMKQYMGERLQRLQNINNLYSLIVPIMFFAALIVYATITRIVVFKHKVVSEIIVGNWLFVSALLGSSLVIIAGLAYVNAFMFDASGYARVASLLIDTFSISTICLGIQQLIIRKKNA